MCRIRGQWHSFYGGGITLPSDHGEGGRRLAKVSVTTGLHIYLDGVVVVVVVVVVGGGGVVVVVVVVVVVMEDDSWE